MATFGSNTKHGAGVVYNISFDGVDRTWGTGSMVSVSSSRYEAESRDSKLNVPTFRANFYDADGSIWTALGDGTSIFDRDLVASVEVGGNYDWVERQAGTFFEKVSTAGADAYTLHTGKASRASKKNKIVTLESRNNMNALKKLKWQFPINDTPGLLSGFSGTVCTSSFIPSDSIYDTDKLLGYVSDSELLTASFTGTGINTSDVSFTLKSGYSFRDTRFHSLYTLYEFRKDGNEIHWPVNADIDTTHVYWVQNELAVSGDPTNIARHLITGVCVSDYFDDSTDIDDTSFVDSAKNYAFNFYTGVLPAKEKHAEPTFEDIQDIVKTTAALFYVDSSNKINLKTYGPRNLSETIDVFTGTDLLEAESSNDIEDSYNRVKVSYDYSYGSSEYTSFASIEASDWTPVNDRTLDIESKWLDSRVEAQTIANRLFSRYTNNTPRIKFSTNLRQLGRGIGDLVKITEPNCGLNEKVVQINSFNADILSSKKVMFEGLDGESLYSLKGYGFWEDESDVAGVWWGAVSGTSTSGWANGGPQSGLPNGTVLNIDETLYGTAFVWW